MKNILFKILLLIPLLFFIDFMLMMVLGCTTCAFGFTSTFYNCTYCTIGKIIVGLSLIIIILAILPDLRKLFNNRIQSKFKLG